MNIASIGLLAVGAIMAVMGALLLLLTDRFIAWRNRSPRFDGKYPVPPGYLRLVGGLWLLGPLIAVAVLLRAS